jgi:hypothetical protein
MPYTAQNIVDRGLALSRRPANASNRADGLEWLNEKYLELGSGEVPFRHQVARGQLTLTGGDSEITLADIATALSVTGVNRVLSLTVDSESWPPLRAFTPEELERWAGGTTARTSPGPPIGWSQWDQTRIKVYPEPDHTYVLGVVARSAPAILALVDEPNWPDAWRVRVFAPWVATRMWEQFSGGEAMNMAGRFEAEHERAVAAFTAEWGGARAEEFAVWWGADLNLGFGGLYG